MTMGTPFVNVNTANDGFDRQTKSLDLSSNTKREKSQIEERALIK